MHTLLVIFSIINLSLPFCASISCPPCPKNDYETIPAYILYILGLMSILLALVLITLIYVLFKTNFLTRLFTTQPVEKLEETVAQCPTCQKKTTGGIQFERNSGDIKNENENIHTLKRQESQLAITNNVNTLRSPKNSDASGNISPRIIKGAAKDLPYILPEQMTLICKEVLKRAAKNDSINSLQNIVNESKPKDEKVLKCASTPALDLCDTPETPHRDKKIKTDNHCSTNLETTASKVTKVEESLKSSSIFGDDEPENSFEIYDFPKESNNDTLTREESNKAEHLSGYVTPCFENESSSGRIKQKEEKQNYAQIKDMLPEQNAIINNCIDYNEYYDNPKIANDTNKMYINANDVNM
ncbi:uncharacterized protein LOC125230807 [Leguminivora glycinivorella]|uniref:uncharacterized protein LOC125230807 n=1 Tax=Leguminivora glycinivorella TaxID=1035111 RepID=UPI00200C9901|nr:uncharacterized protein LOC125230807 [Leguminivora glycinivorella]